MSNLTITHSHAEGTMLAAEVSGPYPPTATVRRCDVGGEELCPDQQYWLVGAGASCASHAGRDPLPFATAQARSEYTDTIGQLEERRMRTQERDAAIAAALAAPTVYATAYFPTPPALANRIAGMLPDRPLTVLEPSAGDGALVRAVLDARPDAAVFAVEPNLQLVRLLGHTMTAAGPGYPSDAAPRVRMYCCTFEDFGRNRAPDSVVPELFGAVVMNPPFSSPGHPVLWAEHVLRAYDLLRPGGRLIAIVPAGFAYRRQDKTSTRLRDLVTELGSEWEDLPEGSFTSAGTQARTVLLRIDRPAADPAAQFDLTPVT